MTRPYLVEPARAADLPALPRIEREAVSLFEPWQLPESVLNDTTSIEEFQAAHDAGLLWIARTPDEVVGFALVELLDGCPHLEEIDVHPAHGRRGVGRALMNAVMTWARDVGYPSITLTTFRDVPWNAPFYERLGFRVLEPSELTPGLEAVVQDEATRGLDRDRRVVMRHILRVAEREPDPYLLGYRQEEQERLGPRGCLGLLSERVGATGPVVGVERNAEQVERARQFVADGHLTNVEVLNADARATGLAEGTFDLATARLELDELTAVLKRHLEDPATLVVSSLFIQAWGRRPDR